MNRSDSYPEDELIRRAQMGECDAFEQIADRHAETLFRSALSLCSDRQLAEDLSQETFLEAWRSIRRFDGRCRLSTWLYGILRHRFLKAVQRFAKQPRVEWLVDAPVLESSVNSDPSRMILRIEETERIRQAIVSLPLEHRQVIELRFFADATLDEIATALAIPVGTVKSRLHHALNKLRIQRLSLKPLSQPAESTTRNL